MTGRYPALRRAVLGAALVAIGLLPAPAAAPDDPEGTVTNADAPATAGKVKPRGLTVQVFVIETATNRPGPAPRAVVRVVGGEDSIETNDKGVAKLSGISVEKVKLQVMVAGADICLLADVDVRKGQGLVNVLVEKWDGGLCKLIE